MASGPVLAMVWEGLNVVATGRVMLGETNPKDSKPGTIRGDFCIQVIMSKGCCMYYSVSSFLIVASVGKTSVPISVCQFNRLV